MADCYRFKKPRRFILCIDRFDAIGNRVWAVGTGDAWTVAKRVDVRVPVVTVFKGPKAKQPKAYLTGLCKIIQLVKTTDTLVIE